MQFYDTPRNVREAIECPPPNPLGNYDYPTAGNDDHILLKYYLLMSPSTFTTTLKLI